MNGEGQTEQAAAKPQVRAQARKVREGVVVSDKMDKTVVVAVERLVRHPRYHKYRRRRARYKAHDQTNRCRVGDRVRIVETRPLSAQKRWAVLAVLGSNESLAEVVPV
jgi:small subunit ribosomal protein S17